MDQAHVYLALLKNTCKQIQKITYNWQLQLCNQEIKSFVKLLVKNLATQTRILTITTAIPNTNDIVFYLYTTYDSNLFHPISITSCPIILAHSREFCTRDGFQLSVIVKLQIIEFPFSENETSCWRQCGLSKASINKTTKDRPYETAIT